MKKIFSLVLTLVMIFTISSTPVMAAEITEPEKTTWEFTVAPGESNDIMPLIWDEFTPESVNNCEFNTSSFYVSDRYFAFESSAIRTDGQPVPDNFTVALKEDIATIATATHAANGEVVKLDWIDLGSGTYYFRIYNTTSYYLRYKITFYSWA